MNRLTQLARQFSSFRESEVPGAPVIHLSYVKLLVLNQQPGIFGLTYPNTLKLIDG